MAKELRGNWKLVDTQGLNEFTTSLGFSDEIKQRYQLLDVKGDDGLSVEIGGEGKEVTISYKLKGVVKHTDKVTIGETTEVTAISGKTRPVTTSIEGDAVVLKSPKAVTRVEKKDGQLLLTMTAGDAAATLKFNSI